MPGIEPSMPCMAALVRPANYQCIFCEHVVTIQSTRAGTTCDLSGAGWQKRLQSPRRAISFAAIQ